MFQNKIFPEQKSIKVQFVDDFCEFSDNSLYIVPHTIDNQFFYNQELNTMQATFNTSSIIPGYEHANCCTLGSSIANRLWKQEFTTFVLDVRDIDRIIYHDIENIAVGFKLTAWSFEKYKSEKSKIETLIVITHNSDQYANKYQHHLIEASLEARSLCCEPANVLNTTELKNKFEALKSDNVIVEVLDKDALAKRGMNGILAVCNGSVNPPYLVFIQYNWNKRNKNKIALVGKGVVFDTGGVSLKDAVPMISMNGDMGGAAAVYSTFKALINSKSQASVMGIVAIVENMPSGSAYRPNDIITTPDGKTVEILNTDAEGRLILHDALCIASESEATHIIDIATLTGAIKAALGPHRAGLFTNDKVFGQEIFLCGEKTYERVWEFPMDGVYSTMLKSDVADIAHVSASGNRDAGSIFAAQYLYKFIAPGKIWAHLDIAGVTQPGNTFIVMQSKGMTSFGTRLLYNVVESLSLTNDATSTR